MLLRVTEENWIYLYYINFIHKIYEKKVSVILQKKFKVSVLFQNDIWNSVPVWGGGGEGGWYSLSVNIASVVESMGWLEPV